MSLVRHPAKTDPLMTPSERREFLPEIERQVVDGGVRDGRLESPYTDEVMWVLLIVIALVTAVGLALNWRLFFP